MAKSPFTPRAGKPFKPTDTAKRNGQFVHPGRMPEIGGAQSLGAPGHPKRNSFHVSKPGKRV